jgi:hypothetical protein
MTEMDYLENAQEVTSTRKNFNAHVPQYFSNKSTYNPNGLNRLYFDSRSFIVDWQLRSELYFETYKL